MKKVKRIAALLLAAVSLCSVVTLTSCSSSANASSKTIVIGVDDTYPPMEYRDSSNSLVGFDVDMANEIAKRTGKTIQWKPTSFDGIFSALNSKKFDCIISSVSITKAREEKYIFSKPYIANSQMIVVKPGDNSIKAQTDLAGKTVGVQSGTTAKDAADKLTSDGIKFKDLKTYDQIIETFSDLKIGRLDAVIVDEVVGQYYIAQSPSDYKAAAVKLDNEPIGICFRKDSKTLRDKVQQAIDDMVADGTMATISKKWFGTDLTSNIDTELRDFS